MATTPPNGAIFVVSEVVDFKIGDRLIARYRPEFNYRVTDVNAAFVGDLCEAKKAALTGMSKRRKNAAFVKVG